LADFEEAKDGRIFQCVIFLFWQRKVPKERGGKPNKHSMSEKLTTTVHSPQNSMPVSYPVFKVKMHAGLAPQQMGLPQHFCTGWMERLVKGPAQSNKARLIG
jgi:hypothetical protein